MVWAYKNGLTEKMPPDFGSNQLGECPVLPRRRQACPFYTGIEKPSTSTSTSTSTLTWTAFEDLVAIRPSGTFAGSGMSAFAVVSPRPVLPVFILEIFRKSNYHVIGF